MKRATEPSSPHDTYPLRTVTTMTGLSADLIRVWEKRYSVVKPIRGARGARLYSIADINHLGLLARAVGSGRAIGDVAVLHTADLQHLTQRPVAATATAPAGLVAGLIECLVRFEHVALARALGDALLALGSRGFVYEVAVPLLHEIGERWSRGEITIADEHFLSGVLRNLLAALIQPRIQTGRPTILLAAPAGERHDLGLLLVTLLANEMGIEVLNLGADLPAPEITSAAERAGARVVGLTIVSSCNRARAVSEIKAVQRRLPAATEIWLGGREAQSVAARLRPFRGLVIADLVAAEPDLERVARAGAARAMALP